MKVKEIAFLGDSFTWGEGLELYLDSPFWINQRNKKSWWSELKVIQTEESIKFRESNRFANIVSEYFDAKLIIDSSNGGYIGNVTKYLRYFLKNNKRPEYIIIQFSSFNRNPIHFHLGSLFRECKCEKCNNYKETLHCFYHFLNTIRKKYVEKEILNNEDEFYLNWLIDEFNFPIAKIENSKDPFVPAFNFVNSVIDLYSYKHLNYLVNEYVTQLERRGSKVFYIDSWDEESSKIIHNIPSIKENLIPLQKWNSLEFSQNYNSFENSFPFKRILNEFKKTENGHPTLVQHQYIATSIIDYIEKFDKKSFFKLF